jgi:hypothetical protein
MGNETSRSKLFLHVFKCELTVIFIEWFWPRTTLLDSRCSIDFLDCNFCLRGDFGVKVLPLLI